MEEVKRKRGRPKKNKLPEEIKILVEEVQEKISNQEEIEELIIKETPVVNSEWDVPIDLKIEYFDANLSYELSGYKPINETRGLDFDPSWFTEARDTYLRTGHYTQFKKGSKAFSLFWREQYIRCKYGYTVNGYTITGDHYFFLNFYQLEDLASASEAGIGRKIIFPHFMEGLYLWFHYLALAKKLKLNACMMKAREANKSAFL